MPFLSELPAPDTTKPGSDPASLLELDELELELELELDELFELEFELELEKLFEFDSLELDELGRSPYFSSRYVSTSWRSPSDNAES